MKKWNEFNEKVSNGRNEIIKQLSITSAFDTKDLEQMTDDELKELNDGLEKIYKESKKNSIF